MADTSSMAYMAMRFLQMLEQYGEDVGEAAIIYRMKDGSILFVSPNEVPLADIADMCNEVHVSCLMGLGEPVIH